MTENSLQAVLILLQCDIIYDISVVIVIFFICATVPLYSDFFCFEV